MRDQSVLVSVALAATLWSIAALSQAETETEVAPSQPVETVPTAPPAPTRPVSDEPSAPAPPVVAPNTARSSETAPAPLPTGALTSGPLESPAVPLPTGADTSRPIEPPRAGSQGFLSGRPKGTTFRDDADSCERARRLYDHSGCAGWSEGGGAFRATRAQHQGRP
jgi:hypothetical protein